MNGGPVDLNMSLGDWCCEELRVYVVQVDGICFLNLIFAGKACFMKNSAQGSHGICGDPSANTQ